MPGQEELDARSWTLHTGTGDKTAIKASAGVLYKIVVSLDCTGTVLIEDDTTDIAAFVAGLVQGTYQFGVPFATSLQCTLSQIADKVLFVYE